MSFGKSSFRVKHYFRWSIGKLILTCDVDWVDGNGDQARVFVETFMVSFFFFLDFVRWCIRLTHLTLVWEVITYRLLQVRQKLKKNFLGWRPAIAFLYLFSFILYFFLLPFFLKTTSIYGFHKVINISFFSFQNPDLGLKFIQVRLNLISYTSILSTVTIGPEAKFQNDKVVHRWENDQPRLTVFLHSTTGEFVGKAEATWNDNDNVYQAKGLIPYRPVNTAWLIITIANWLQFPLRLPNSLTLKGRK